MHTSSPECLSTTPIRQRLRRATWRGATIHPVSSCHTGVNTAETKRKHTFLKPSCKVFFGLEAVEPGSSIRVCSALSTTCTLQHEQPVPKQAVIIKHRTAGALFPPTQQHDIGPQSSVHLTPRSSDHPVMDQSTLIDISMKRMNFNLNNTI